jgi:putative ABC transport system permease protein
LEDDMHDLQLALRSLRSAGVVTVAVVLSLAFGIGANTAIFSLVNGLLLRPLPVAQPERLVTVSSAYALAYGYKTGIGWNYQMWQRFQPRAEAFGGAFAWWVQPFDLSQGGAVQRVNGIVASGGFFSTLGVRPFLGRAFGPGYDVRGGGPDGAVVVISYGLWQRRFGGTPGVIGTTLMIERVPFTIIGVTPPEFFGIEVGQSFDVAIPLGTDVLIHGARSALDQPRSLMLAVMLRLAPDQSVEAATAALRVMQPDIAGSDAPQFVKEPYVLVPAATGSSDRSKLRLRYERPLVTLSIVIGLVLLVACGNISNLLLARAAARRYEMSVRLALGAPRWRLVRQLIVEHLLMGGVGAALGLVFAVWASKALVAQLSTTGDPVFAGTPIFLDLSLDWRVLAFTVAAGAGTAIVFGTAPALGAARISPIEALRGARQTVAGQSRSTLPGSLVVSQVALSLVVVVAAGLFTATFRRLAAVPLGVDADRVLVVNLDSSRSRVEPAERRRLHERIVSELAALPGVEHAAGSTSTPVAGGASNLLVDARGRAANGGGRVMWNFVTPDWFATYGIPVRAGREFTFNDVDKSARVVVVNEAFARKFFAGTSALGVTLDATINDWLTDRTVVGIVADAIYGSPRDPVPPAFYLPLSQSAGKVPDANSIRLGVRAAGASASALAPRVGAAIASVDRDVAFSLRSLADHVDDSLAQERLLAALSSAVGVLAIVLAAVGVYGVTAYAVNRRRTEIGIRLALGAEPQSVIRLMLWKGVRLLSAGVLIGVPTSLWLSRFVAPLLYGLEPRDPATLAIAIVTLTSVGVVSSWLAAAVVSRMNPADVLRRT